MEKILSGQFKAKFGDKEIDNWVEHLQRTYNEAKLKKEVQHINKPKTMAELISFFKKKMESTEYSPSKRHIRHYKIAALGNDLSYLHTLIINIGLINGIALPQWKRCVDIMIEKVKGDSKIHRLRIIQLF